MDDALIVLAIAAGELKPAKPAWDPDDPISAWLVIGKSNMWIRQAWDPPFDRRSFTECDSIADLGDRLKQGNCSLGRAFSLGDICFINQVDGGDEWLVIKQNVAFDSWTVQGRRWAPGEFEGKIRKIQASSPEECRRLQY